MSVYKLTKLAQQLEMEQDSRSADFMLRSAMDLDRHIKTAEIEIDVLTKLARDFRPVTQAPAGNRPGYAPGIKGKLNNFVAAIKALVELHQEVSEQAIGGQGPLVKPLIDSYQTLLKDRKSLEKLTWDYQTGADIYNTPVYRQGYPHTPGFSSSTNVGARAGAALMAHSRPKFTKEAQQASSKQTYIPQTFSDISRGTQQTWQTGKNMLNPGQMQPGQQTYIGDPGTIAQGAYLPETRPMGRGRDPLFSGGVAHGMMPGERVLDPEYQVYGDLGGYSKLAPEAVAAATSFNPENIVQSKVGPTLMIPLFNRFKELFQAHGGTLPKDDKTLNDVFLIGAQKRSGITLNEIAKRGLQLITNALFRPQMTAAEAAGNVAGQGAGIVGNLAGGALRRSGPPLSGMAPGITSNPYGP